MTYILVWIVRIKKKWKSLCKDYDYLPLFVVLNYWNGMKPISNAYNNCVILCVFFMLKTEGEFTWDTETQELILASFFYGYIFTQTAGGWLADRFGVKWVMALGILISCCASLLGPMAARESTGTYIATRVIAGLGEVMIITVLCTFEPLWKKATSGIAAPVSV